MVAGNLSLLDLPWLPPKETGFREACRRVPETARPGDEILRLARQRLELNDLSTLSRTITSAMAAGLNLAPLDAVHLAILSNSTADFLAQALPASAARHGCSVRVTVPPFNTVTQEALQPDSLLHRSRPDLILLSLSNHYLNRGHPAWSSRVAEDEWVSVLADELKQVTPHNLFHGAVRVVFGFLKYKFLANYIYLLTFSSLWNDGFKHSAYEWVVSCVAYYAYLYANFSGACDVAVGAASLAGIRVDENFDAPWRARNLKEFWTRWHMTLSFYLRDVFFTPVSMVFLRLLGPRWQIHTTVVAAFGTMVLIGAWHGFDFGYLAFGLAQGIGCRSSIIGAGYCRGCPSVRSSYRNSGGIRFLATVLTHGYVALTLFFFENPTIEKVQQVLSMLRW